MFRILPHSNLYPRISHHQPHLHHPFRRGTPTGPTYKE